MDDREQRCSRCEHWERLAPGERSYCAAPLPAYLLNGSGWSIPSAVVNAGYGDDCRAFRALPVPGAQSVTHALITPWALSREPRSWCGRLDSRDYVAGAPEAVTCEECIDMMRRVQVVLRTWVPRLPEVGHG